jgi:hypothetical protein
MSKWIKLKHLLKDKSSYESSVKLLKTKTIEQFASKCCEIYKEKIRIYLLLANNKQIVSSWIKTKNKDLSYYLPNVIIKKDLSTLCKDSSIQDFLFYFRENNEYMLNLINCLNKDKRKVIIPFLCHFFYENFFMETPEQEEILYIIYLLLEKEIDNLNSPSVLSFLDDTFLGEFLVEMGNKYEISKYIDNILNDLIREVEEKNSEYNSLEIIYNSKMHYKYFIKDNTFFNMNYENDNSQSNIDDFDEKKNIFFLDYCPTSINNTYSPKKRKITLFHKEPKYKNIYGNNKFGNATIINSQIKFENMPLRSFINKNFFKNISEYYLKDLLAKEKNDIMKSFYMKQINILNANNLNYFNSNNYYEKIKDTKYISKLSVEQFNKAYEIIINFISKLLSNLENIIIIPYNIKVICKFIDILIQKKFPNISRIQCNSLICRFLFDKLILPVLENPDVNNSAKKMVISLKTRKILSNVYEVLKRLIRGEFFNSETSKNYTIFNKFIMQNYIKINNIIQNIINVKIPDKLLLLSNQFYNDDDFSLENLKRNNEDINYNYFDKNPNDFMQHKSICFNINQFLLIYGIVHTNKDIFVKKGTTFEKIYNKITENISSMRCGSISDYYVIIKDEYNNEINELLFSEDKKYKLNKPENENDALLRIKYCISYIFSNIKVLHFWGWMDENYNTLKTFQFIHQYLTNYGEKCFPPLNWYSQFIVNNLHLINKDYINNDYELLYNEIKDDVKLLIKRLKKLNAFLTVNMTTKFYLIENTKKNFQKELENVKRTELNIKALLFIELSSINICLMKGYDYNKYLNNDEKPINNSSLIICKQKYCPHFKSESKEINKINEKLFHCKNVKEFADKFSNFHEFISQEIINYSFGPDYYNSKQPLFGFFNNELNNENIIITDSPKKILETYMNFISIVIQGNAIFSTISTHEKNGFEIIQKKNNHDENLILKKEKEEREKVINIIWNYILKSLCNKMHESKSLFVDQVFNLRCISLSSFVKPCNLHIPDEILDENILSKIKYHIEKIDELRTPGGMIEEFGIVVHLINSLYKFFLNQKQTEAGDILPVLIYCIISVKPKRIIFNLNFSKFFLSEKDLLGGLGYNMIQVESSINFIKNLEANQIGISQEEFNKYSSTIIFK